MSEPTEDPSADSQFFVAMTCASELMGVALTAQGALLDMVAQEAITGEKCLDSLLKELGQVASPTSGTGKAILAMRRAASAAPPLVSHISVPVGIAKANGILRFKVIKEEIPPFIPASLTRDLRMQLELSPAGAFADASIRPSFHQDDALRRRLMAGPATFRT